MSPQFVELPPSGTPSGGPLPSTSAPSTGIPSTDQAPAVDSDMEAWLNEARGWEELAAFNRKIIRVNAIEPSKADYETFGQAWQAIRSECSPTNPFIIELAAGVHYPYNAEGRGLEDFMHINVDHHPGGLVVRGAGPDTWIIFPSGLTGVANESEVQIAGGSLYIKDCWIGFSFGQTSASSAQYNEFERPKVESFLPAGSVCSARGSTFPDTSCIKGTPSAIFVVPGTTGEQSRILIENCIVCSSFDLIVTNRYGIYAPSSTTTPSEPRMLVAFVSCRFYGMSNTTSATGQNDGFTIFSPNTSVLIRNCNFLADWVLRLVWTNFDGIASEGNRGSDPTKIWIEKSHFALRRSTGASGFAPATMLELTAPAPAAWFLVARDSVFEMTGEDVAFGGQSAPTLFDGQTVTFNVCQCVARATVSGASARLYLERSVLRHRLNDGHFTDYAAADKVATFGCGFLGSPSGASARIDVIDTKIDVTGNASELARYQRDIPCSPAGQIVIG